MRKLRHLSQIADRYIGKKSSLSFWYLPVGPYSQESAGLLKGYAIDFRNKAKYSNLDSQGIPIINYKSNIGPQYNGCAISQYALGLHQLYLDTKDKKYQEKFLAQADWLLRNQEDISSQITGVWPLKFDLLAYHLDAPWISSLIQSQAISVLLRAYEMTQNELFLIASDSAFGVFLKPVIEGGVTVSTGEGSFFEEAPSNKPSCILDGFLYSLIGVHEYALFRNDWQALKLRDSAEQWLEKNISRFDIGFWSRADLYQKIPPCPASRFYHQVHIWQLEAFHEISGNEALAFYAMRWKRFDQNPVYRLIAMVYKIMFKILYY